MKNLKKIDTATNIKDLSKDQLIELQQALSNLGYDYVWIDGIYGKQTRKAFNDFKIENDLEYLDLIGKTTVDFIVNKLEKKEKKTDFTFKFLKEPMMIGGKKMLVALPPDWKQTALSETDYLELSNQFALSVPTIKAVLEVESGNSGFLLKESAPCRPKILFEGHIFYRQSSVPVSKIRPDLSYASWTKKYYKGGSAEWDRLLDAYAFDPNAALQSASWGLGQIMGFNYSILGYNNVEDMVLEAHLNEYYQAKQFFSFCSNHPTRKLIYALKIRDWATFAYYYNGAGYRKNEYDLKLKRAYQKYAK